MNQEQATQAAKDLYEFTKGEPIVVVEKVGESIEKHEYQIRRFVSPITSEAVDASIQALEEQKKVLVDLSTEIKAQEALLPE